MIAQDHIKIFLLFVCVSIQLVEAQVTERIQMHDTYPWCIVAYDSLERSPVQRIKMLKDLGFTKYAYDWRDRHLPDTSYEFELAQENNIEIISVWLWLNAKRDPINQLSEANKKLFTIVEDRDLKTTFWLGLSPNYFENLNEDESLKLGIQLVEWVASKAKKIGCKVALYNHSGWFADPYNQMKIIKALPEYELTMVYNFHHAHNAIDSFQEIAELIAPYLSAVNLNGMKQDGAKILGIGKGDHEKAMIEILMKAGFSGPWGIMGHVGNKDARIVLENNINGLIDLKLMHP